MNGYGLAVWSSLLLAELLVVVVVLHVFWLRRRWQRKANHLSKTLTPFLPEIAAKAKAIKDGYRHLIDETASDTSTLLEMISTYERELEELLLSGLDGTAHGYHTPNTDPLQPLWNDMREGHALLNTMTNALFGKTQLLQNLMERMKTQEQLLHELTELSTTYQKKLREFIKEPIEQQSIPDILEKLTQHYQILQDKLDELSVSNHDLFMKDSQYRTFSEQYRNFFETLQILKLENLRLAEKLRIQEPKLEWLRREKTRLDEELERFKGLDEAHRIARRKASHLEEQLQRANEESQRLKSEISALTGEYLKLFERQSS